MENLYGAEKLKREIVEMARREAAGMEAEAEAGAARLLEAARVEAGREVSAISAAAGAEAEKLRALTLAAVPAETARLRAAAREELLEAVKAAAARRLKAMTGRAARLAAQAISGMEGDSFVVTVMPAENKPGLAQEIAALAGRAVDISVAEGALPGGGGALVRSADGRRVWDNSFGARLERAWPRLRGGLLPGAGENK